MKKSFTLIEILISIILFSIILVFLYEVLNSTKNHNEKYTEVIEKFDNKYNLEYIFLEDILNLDGNVSFDSDKNDNTIFVFKTSNTYHNPFYTNVVYFLNKENELLRIETSQKFNKDNIYKILDKSYIDIVSTDVKKFKIEKIKNKYFIYIQFENNEKVFFPLIYIKS